MLYVSVVLEFDVRFGAVGVAFETEFFDKGFMEVWNWVGIYHDDLTGSAAGVVVVVLGFFVAALADGR